MNLRDADSYNVGLDLGTGSVGWAVTDEDGELLHFKGRPTWGSRVFPSGKPAAQTRLARGQRRRYERRRWRLNLLQDMFREEMAGIDDEFFIRLNQSRLHPEDRMDGHADYRWPFFNATDFTERDYYAKFPTIYHLRAWLMQTNDQADLRLIYLAFHNIVKTRGNFLHQDNRKLSASNADMTSSIETLCLTLTDWCDAHDIETSCCDHIEDMCKTLEDPTTNRGEKQSAFQDQLCFDKENRKTLGAQISKAIIGYKAEFASIFFEEADESKFSLSNDDAVEAYLSHIPDDGMALFDAIRGVYSAFILSGILSFGGDRPIKSGILKGSTGKTISYCKVREYEQYNSDLTLLKALTRKFAPDKFNEFFRGEFYPGTHNYDPSKAKGYTKYNLLRAGASYDDFKKNVIKLFEGTQAAADPQYKKMMASFGEERFLRRLKTSDNGSIPYQLHLEEMNAIITNQGHFYPFLLAQRDKIESLVSFRIPYYVGPLTQKNAARDQDGKLRFAWSVHRQGKENEPVYPWNWDQVIDKNRSAQKFIERMTSDCTYLVDEPVLPKCSLLYEEYCVLNELNGTHYSADGDKQRRFDCADRQGIIDDLFKQKHLVTYKSVEDWMRENRKWTSIHVSGGQGETKFESNLSSYRFFCKDVFHVDELPESLVPKVEQIILWNTLFEDRSILKEELKRNFGDILSAEQVKTICHRRFRGWGRLSRKFLIGLKTDTDHGPKSIMDIMREGCPTSGESYRQSMVLMEIIHDSNLDFMQLIEQENQKKLAAKGKFEVNDLPGSPANRRTVNQATRIVEEIARIAGKAPTHIFIETTRDEDPKNKGKRTKRRWEKLNDTLKAFKDENSELIKEFEERNAKEFDDDRLMLYFMQGGKSLYSGKPIDIERLSEYQIDHIIPQSYIKDDSLENKALVLSKENQSKTNSLLISPSIRQRMAGYWRELHRVGLIGDKKFNNLLCSNISDRKIKGFISRQLVETSQSTKLTKIMLENRFPETRVLGIRAGLSHELREVKHYPKCREINDFHHAHDALLAAEIGRFLLKRHSEMYDNPVGYAHVVRNFIHAEALEASRTGHMPSSAGFIISSFLHSGFDKGTGEVFKDSWDAEYECERIGKFFNYKQVFISRMPEETNGAFWDATVYSPRDKSKKISSSSLPVKQGLDPAKYGAFSNEQFAYFFIYKEKDKKGKCQLVFSSVPVRISAQIELGGIKALENYAKKEAAEHGAEFVGVIRNKIYKYQQIEIGSDRFFITGKKEVRNARQFAFTQDETELFTQIKRGFFTDEMDLESLFGTLQDKFIKLSPKLAQILKISSIGDSFSKLDKSAQAKVLCSLVSIAAAKTNMIDMTLVGGSKTAGCIRIAKKKYLNNEEGITFVDQSVTGMFERRTHIGL
ncbi:MAG: type II CRISPR RNA-guided endonuclease Cas9 [Olegusella sp.]|jgi:CRISPR-associated endonuclease Csn1|nr:type II CRISPR RNA-guided endonuclease Cas9 [Olegusella sp.]